MSNVFGAVVSRMSGRERLFAYVVTLAIPTVGILFLALDDVFEKVIAALVVAVVIWFATMIALPAEERRQRTLRYSTYAVFALAMAVVFGDSFLAQFVTQLIAPIWPSASLLVNNHPSAAPVTALFVVFAAHIALILFVYGRDRSAMGRATESTASELRDLDLGERLEILCSELKDDLSRTDHSLRWNAAQYVSLDAEVDIIDRSWKERRVVDLLSALKETRSARVTIVLGVPGSGKSVALRKLSRDLLAETGVTGRIPVYVNLKEWLPDFKWTSDKLPTEQDLSKFVKANVRARLSDQTKPFFDDSFELLQRTGRLFFVFDSFDEIPGILDENESSVLLKELSTIFSRFIKSGRDSRGVLASRYYRQPQIQDEDRKTLEIRPFTEYQIYQAIRKVVGSSQEIKQVLFDERPELGAASRNPFVLSLIIQYLVKHQTLPAGQTELYDSYINMSLDLAQDELAKRDLSREELTNTMHEAAWVMFESERFGLEMPLELLQERLPGRRIQDAFAILEGARLVRIGSPARSTSFVHRRFNEYFLIGRFQDEPERIPMEAIPQDSRWRDAIVLFAEVADYEHAKRIANFCWVEVQQLDTLSVFEDPAAYLRSIHSLRFLTEAFRSRAAALEDFRGDLGDMASRVVSQSEDLLTIKHGVESVGLLNPSHSESVLVSALARNNAWISQAALRSCRYMARLNVDVERRLIDFLSTLPTWGSLVDGRDLRFSLNTSDVYKRCLNFIRMKLCADTSNVVSLIGLILLFPVFVLCSIFFRSLIDAVFSKEGFYYDLRVINYPDYVFWSCRSMVLVIGPIFFSILFLSDLNYVDDKFIGNVDFFEIYFDYYRSAVLVLSPGYTYMGSISSYLFALLALMILPWVRIFVSFKRITEKNFLINALNELGKFIILGGTSAFGFFAIRYFLVDFLNIDEGLIVSYFSYTMVIVVLVLFLAGLFASGVSYFRDLKAFRHATSVFDPRRDQIAKAFNSLRSDRARLKYLRWVEGQAGPHIERLSDPQNSWPGGIRPNVRNDSSSVMLAMLDAKWLKLDV